jgi:hypothetical protein
MKDKQAKAELRIFKGFVSVSGLPIVDQSIEKRDPPEPDIKCHLVGTGTITFELTELIDRSFANMVGKQYETKAELDKYYAEMPQDLKTRFTDLYSDAIIFVHFNNELSLRQRKKIFPRIFQHLLGLDKGFEGDTLKRDSKYGDDLKWISISRGVSGPLFDDVLTTSIGDPTVQALKAKFVKNYSTDYLLHLLAYIDLNPMFRDDIWLPKIKNFVKNNISASPFDKVWIYDFHKKEIKYSHP